MPDVLDNLIAADTDDLALIEDEIEELTDALEDVEDEVMRVEEERGIEAYGVSDTDEGDFLGGVSDPEAAGFDLFDEAD